MKAYLDRKKTQRSGPLHVWTLLVTGALGGCYNGNVTEQVDQDDILYRDISGVARPGDPTRLGPITFAPRATFGSANSADALGYPNLPAEGRALMDTADPNSPLTFFTIPHTDAEGVGPLFNQRRCLGCHFSSTDVRDNNLQDSVRFNGQVFTTLNTVNTPVSRAARQGPTQYDYVHDNYRPNTAAFTLFGDFFPATGAFNPIEILGGPLQHVHSVSLSSNGCVSEIQPPQSRDPFLQGGIDPQTGLSMLGAFRAIGERAGPPYIGRGLMEAIYYADLLSNEDFQDTQNDTEPCLAGGTPPAGQRSCSSLSVPGTITAVDHSICPGDCISGRHNEGRADININGGDPLQRVGRFGLRAAGTTMLQFDVGGTRGEIGLTSLFAPAEEPFPQNNVNKGCDQPADPEIRVEVVRNLRAMIRLFAPPDYVADFRQQPPTTPLAMELQAGAALFGLDMQTFLSRTTAGQQAVRFGDYNADRGIAVDRRLNCVSCHVPIQRTGESPAQIAPDLLSNKWAPIFSDLLIHVLPTLPQGRPEFLYPNVYQGAGVPMLRAYYDAVYANGFSRPGLSRSLGDAAVPVSVTGIANPNEFRTAPLMGIGKTGPPFLHDARVYVNVVGKLTPDTAQFNPDGSLSGLQFPDDRATDPAAPPAIRAMATTVYTDSTGANLPLMVDTVEHALQATIELHDLPAPPGNDYANCPAVAPDIDVCSRNSRYRGEARNTMEKWHALTPAQQLQVIRFLLTL